MIVNRDIATSAAAELTLPNLKKSLNASPCPSKLLEEAIIPIFGITRSARIVRRLGSRKLNGLLCLLRNSTLSQSSYARVAQLWKDACQLDLAISPNTWEQWRTLIGNFDLDGRYPLPSRVLVIQWCQDHQFTFPATLAARKFSELQTIHPSSSPKHADSSAAASLHSGFRWSAKQASLPLSGGLVLRRDPP